MPPHTPRFLPYEFPASPHRSPVSLPCIRLRPYGRSVPMHVRIQVRSQPIIFSIHLFNGANDPASLRRIIRKWTFSRLVDFKNDFAFATVPTLQQYILCTHRRRNEFNLEWRGQVVHFKAMKTAGVTLSPSDYGCGKIYLRLQKLGKLL